MEIFSKPFYCLYRKHVDKNTSLRVKMFRHASCFTSLIVLGACTLCLDRARVDASYDGLDKTEEYDGMYVSGDDAATGPWHPLDLPLVIINVCVITVGLVANCVVFFVIFAGRETSKTVTALYIVQLAVADTTFLLTMAAFIMQKYYKHWSAGQVFCKFSFGVKFVNYYSGVFFLTAMSVDRYIAVAYSTASHKLRTRKRTLLICTLVWLASILMSLPVLLYAQIEEIDSQKFCRLMFPGYEMYNDADEYYIGNGYQESDNHTYEEDKYSYDVSTVAMQEDSANQMYGTTGSGFRIPCVHHDQSRLYKGWIILNFIVGFLAPFVVISVSYILILKQLRASENRVADLSGKKTATVRKRVTVMVAVLVVCFAACWLPVNILNLLKIPGFETTVTGCHNIESILGLLAFSNSAINPILYSFLGHSFRSRLRETIATLSRRWRRNSSIKSAGGNVRTPQSNSDNSVSVFDCIYKANVNTHRWSSLRKKINNFVAMRKLGRSEWSSKDEQHQNLPLRYSSSVGRRQRTAIPTLDVTKRKDEGRGGSKEADDPNYSSRTNGLSTEVTRVAVAEKENSSAVVEGAV